MLAQSSSAWFAAPRVAGRMQAPPAPLTIKPSLFFPPRMYRLPSLGSGRNAGLERTERVKREHPWAQTKG